MKERISALMDGELDDRSAAALIQALEHDREALESWRLYHLMGDAMRETRLLSQRFAARIGERLAAEPTVLAAAVAAPAEPRRRVALPIAASLAAVALVGWLAFAPQREAQAPQVAQLAAAPAKPAAQAKPPVLVIPLPSATSDYLLAHQGFSPRVSFQGMAPYVRTVSGEVQGARR